MKKLLHLGVAALLAGVIVGLPIQPVEARPAPGSTIHIGVMKTLFRDAPEGLVTTLSKPLSTLVEAQTGLPGAMRVVTQAKLAAEQLEKQEIQIAVMHSFEYGWARQINPNLRVLVMACRAIKDNRFALVVRQDSGLQSMDDLKGTKVAVPFMTKEPGHLFLEGKCCGGECPSKVFKELTAPSDGEDALNDVVTRAVQAALVEKSTLDAFLKAKPKQANNLKTLAISEDFPSGVLVYREGHIPAAQLAQFRDGLFNASSNPKNRDMLKIIKLTGFESPPADYDAQVEAIIKAYPNK
jgi:ABC-type phosphate/phosphonate transport system substrate-binding protein